MPGWLSDSLASPTMLVQMTTLTLAVVGMFILLLLVLEARRMRRVLGSRLDVCGKQLAAFTQLFSEDVPVRYALAGMIVVQKGQKQSAAELRRALHEVLEEWKQADQIVSELKDTISRLGINRQEDEATSRPQNESIS